MTTRTAERLGLVGWLALSFAAAAVGGIASANAPDFYMSLERPRWAPPPWLFGPVWTTLYALIGIAAWLVWRVRATDASTARHRRRGLRLFAAQLALNALWTWLFFAWRQGGWAFGEIVVLAAAIAVTARWFAAVRPLAGVLMLPYLAWVLFATALTWSIWQANPDRV